MEKNVREVSLEEASNIRGGEVITIGLVCAVLSIASSKLTSRTFFSIKLSSY